MKTGRRVQTIEVLGKGVYILHLALALAMSPTCPHHPYLSTSPHI